MAAETTPKITPFDNCCIKAENCTSLTSPDGSTETPEGPLFLCRCGKSAKKPYCDGSHKNAGFSSETTGEAASHDRVYTYEGTEITVQFNRLLCSHAAECGKRLPEVFDTTARPWVAPDKGSVEAIKDVIRACPSGALSYRLKGAAQNISGDAATITIDKDGPYRVENMALGGDPYWATDARQDKYVLCRCGLSENKPFCDGSHRDQGWKDDA